MESVRHHGTAVCHIATTLLTRVATSWRHGEPYQIRDVDGTPLTQDQAHYGSIASHTPSDSL